MIYSPFNPSTLLVLLFSSLCSFLSELPYYYHLVPVLASYYVGSWLTIETRTLAEKAMIPDLHNLALMRAVSLIQSSNL